MGWKDRLIRHRSGLTLVGLAAVLGAGVGLLVQLSAPTLAVATLELTLRGESAPPRAEDVRAEADRLRSTASLEALVEELGLDIQLQPEHLPGLGPVLARINRRTGSLGDEFLGCNANYFSSRSDEGASPSTTIATLSIRARVRGQGCWYNQNHHRQ